MLLRQIQGEGWREREREREKERERERAHRRIIVRNVDDVEFISLRIYMTLSIRARSVSDDLN